MAAKKPKTKWKWNEFDEWKEQQKQPPEDSGGEMKKRKSGQCDKCGGGSFRLKVEMGKMDRTCQNCGEVKEDV
jgi:hypothetical protein